MNNSQVIPMFYASALVGCLGYLNVKMSTLFSDAVIAAYSRRHDGAHEANVQRHNSININCDRPSTATAPK